MGAEGTRIAVTGHRDLADPSAVRAEVDAVLATLARPLVCVSALAAGADQLVARAVLDAGGSLEAVIPFAGYESSLPEADRAPMRALRDAASIVVELPSAEAGSPAYAAAGRQILQEADLLIAVWDEGPSRGSGGTADVVRMAQERGIPVRIIEGRRAPE